MQQSNLEQANVEAVTEISDLIAAQRAYEMNAKVITRRRPDAAIHRQHVPLRRMKIIVRPLLFATALLAATTSARSAQTRADVIASPVLRASVTVSGDLVRIGDVIDNAGAPRKSRSTARRISAPPAAAGGAGLHRTARASGDRRRHPEPQGNLGDAAGAHARGKDIEIALARALERRNGLGEAANLEPDLRPRRAAISASTPRTPAPCKRSACATTRATTGLTSRSRSPTSAARRRQNCASPARPLRPSKPPFWRGASSATR